MDTTTKSAPWPGSPEYAARQRTAQGDALDAATRALWDRYTCGNFGEFDTLTAEAQQRYREDAAVIVTAYLNADD